MTDRIQTPAVSRMASRQTYTSCVLSTRLDARRSASEKRTGQVIFFYSNIRTIAVHVQSSVSDLWPHLGIAAFIFGKRVKMRLWCMNSASTPLTKRLLSTRNRIGHVPPIIAQVDPIRRPCKSYCPQRRVRAYPCPRILEKVPFELCMNARNPA